MKKQYLQKETLEQGDKLFLPSVSIDCVIFGFHADQLKVLLLQFKHNKKWALPGGFIYKDEHVTDAAARILQSRTGLKEIFLQQFHLFGHAKRTQQKHTKKLLEEYGIVDTATHWLTQRFVTVGYYALVEYAKAEPQPDELSSQCRWKDLTDLDDLIIDHKEIIDKALQTLRLHLKYQPIGYNLLPEEFTLKELQLIYETILGRKLDRANFQRKILGYGILDKKQKHFTGAAHKAAFLYSFNEENYFKALENGLDKDW